MVDCASDQGGLDQLLDEGRMDGYSVSRYYTIRVDLSDDTFPFKYDQIGETILVGATYLGHVPQPQFLKLRH